MTHLEVLPVDPVVSDVALLTVLADVIAEGLKKEEEN